MALLLLECEQSCRLAHPCKHRCSAVIEYPLLQHFVAVARRGSFTQAAEEVHACRSVVTRSVQRLEDRVGTKLFDRTTRSVKLTSAGESLFRDVEAMGERIAVAMSKARRIGQGTNAAIRVGLCSSAHSTIATIAEAIGAFREAYPQVEVVTTSTSRDRMGNALRASRLDIGIMALNRGDCKELEWRVLASSPMKLWLPPSWQMNTPSVRLEQFRDRHWVLSSPRISPDMLEMQLALCRSAGFTPQEVSYTEDVLDGVMMRACEQGAVFIHEWDAPEGDPSVKSIENLPGYCTSEIVVAWAEGAMCDHMGKFVEQMFNAMGAAKSSFPVMPCVA